MDPSIFEPVNQEPSAIVNALVSQLTKQYGKSYPWATGKGRQPPAGYILVKKTKAFQSGRPIISFVDSPFRPMPNILARMIFQLIPVACPDHFASGDVYTLLSILREAPVDGNLILINQDLAGFFTSIDQARFIGAWYMLLDFLRPHMSVADNEVFSVYPGKSNKPRDLFKGRTFRRLNVARKIVIKDVPSLLKTALNMQTFAWANVASDNVEAVLWEVHCLQHVASWLYPSVSKFGPSTSNRFSPTITCSSNIIFDMLTTDSFLEMLVPKT